MSLFQTLKPKPKSPSARGCCLLLDTSGSMEATVNNEEGEVRRIDALFRAVRDTPECQGLKAFMFNSSCYPIETIPTEAEADRFAPYGGTNLADAFTTVKAAGFFHAVLVTDGEPDNELKALAAAQGMKLGIIYIGNPPTPLFLQRLAQATDGTFEIADIRKDGQLALAIQHALPPPTPADGGTIPL